MKLSARERKETWHQRAGEAMGSEPTERVTIFDPERDVPAALREGWAEGSKDPELARAFGASFALTFPGRRHELGLEELWTKLDVDTAGYLYLDLILLFPDKLSEVRRRMLAARDRDLAMGMRFYDAGQAARYWTAVQILFPERVAEYAEKIEEAWEALRRECAWSAPNQAQLCADARLMFPDRFTAGIVDPGILRGLANQVQREMRAHAPRFTLGTAMDIAALSVLTAREVNLRAMGGIEIVRDPATDSHAPKPLPDRATL